MVFFPTVMRFRANTIHHLRRLNEDAKLVIIPGASHRFQEEGKRQRDILVYLLNAENYVTCGEIANEFQVSNRSARNDVEMITSFMCENNCQIDRRQGVGIRVFCSEADSERIKKIISTFHAKVFNKEERNHLITAMLLLNDTVTFQELADVCGVSKQTIINHFNDIIESLLHDNLSVEKTQGVGLKLIGEERCIRRKFNQMLIIEEECQLCTEIFLTSKELTQNMHRSVEILNKVKNQLDISYVNKTRVQSSLAYGMCRAQKGFVIEFGEKESLIKQNMEPFASILREYIHEESELFYAIDILLGERIYKNALSEQLDNDEAHQISMYLIRSLEQLEMEEVNNTDMIQGLTLHLRSVIYRYRNNIKIKNDMLDEIKMSVSVIYEFTAKKLQMIEKMYGIEFDENEIAFIAMYIASIYQSNSKNKNILDILVICSFGLATSSILKNRILATLPECNLLGPMSKAQAEGFLADHKVDMVISTSEFHYKDTLTVIVNPMLSQKDIEQIRDELHQLSYLKMCRQFIRLSSQIEDFEESKHYIRDYMREDDIRILDFCGDWKEAIKIAAQPLIQKGDITDSYVNKMIQAVKDFGTYMVLTPKTAYVHAGTEDGILRNCTSMLVLKHALKFGTYQSKTVKNIVVLGIKNSQENGLLNMVYILGKEENIFLLEREEITKTEILNMHD